MKHRLLYILHAYHNHAGTESHTRTLAKALSGNEFEISIAFPERGNLWLLEQNGNEVAFPGWQSAWPLTEVDNPACYESLAKLLEHARPEIIHLQHFYNWPLGTIKRLVETKVPVAVSFHDYYFYNPVFTGQGTHDVFSAPEEVFHPAYSQNLFQQNLSREFQLRFAVIRESLLQTHTLIAPSKFLANLVTHLIGKECRIIEHGIEPFAPLPKVSSKALRAGFLGALLQQKGYVQLLKGFHEARKGHPSLELHLYGTKTPQTPAITLPEGAFWHGTYNTAQLPAILSKVDFGLIPSTFAETYSLVLSEFWMGGVPVAAAKIGALAERVADGENGKLFASGDTAAIADVLEWFCSHEDWRSWKLPVPRSTSSMADDYRDLYQRMKPFTG